MRAGGWARRGAGSMGVGQPTCSAPGTRPAQRVGSMRQTCWHAGHLLCTVGGQRGVDVLARWAVPVQASGQADVLAAWTLGTRRAGRRAPVLPNVWAACGRLDGPLGTGRARWVGSGGSPCRQRGRWAADVLARWALPVQAGGLADVLAAWALGGRRAGRRVVVPWVPNIHCSHELFFF